MCPANSHRLAWLFDIDGTLLTTDGAAREAFSHAVRVNIGADDDLKDIAFAGRIEPQIFADILRKHGCTFGEREEARFWDSVFDRMRETLHDERGYLMPGVANLLDAVAAEPSWAVGLLTGNMTQMARIKLGRFGLRERFEFGGFGEMAADRNALAIQTVASVGERYGVPPSRCIVIGDTDNDIACARAAGAHVVAVATGWTERAELERLGPDLMLDDLSNATGLLEWARGIEARG